MSSARAATEVGLLVPTLTPALIPLVLRHTVPLWRLRDALVYAERMSATVKPLGQLLRKYLVDLSSGYARVHNDRRQTGKKVSQLGFQILAIHRRRHSPRHCRQGCLTEGPLWAPKRRSREPSIWRGGRLPVSGRSLAPTEVRVKPSTPKRG